MNSATVLPLVGVLLLGLIANTAGSAKKPSRPQPQLSIKSTLGVTKRRGVSESFATVADEWSEGDKYGSSSDRGDKVKVKQGQGAIQEKSDTFADTLILALPVLFLPALLLALLYLIWAGSYSSYNYHNNYPNSFGTHGGPAVGFGHYGNGLQGVHGRPGGGHGGKFRKTDRVGDAASTSQAYLAHKVEQATSSVLGSIHKASPKYGVYSHPRV